MSANVCPSCNKPLPAAVVDGPAQAVVRCEGCQTLLLWSNGRVMRSAKSSTGTMMGMPAVTAKPATPVLRDAEAPLPELRPEADAAPLPATGGRPGAAQTPPPRTATQTLGRPAPPRPTVTGLGESAPTRVTPAAEVRKETARKDPTPAPAKPAATAPPKVAATAPPKVAATAPPRVAATAPPRVAATAPPKVAPAAPPKAAATAPPRVAPAAPPKVAPAAPAGAAPTAPAKAAPSGPMKLPPPAPSAPPRAEQPKADPGKSEAPHVVVAAVAQVPQMGGGELVDPSAWFAGDVSDVVPPEKLPPIESLRAPRGETTGAQPLPPPPELPSLPPLEVEPFEVEAPTNDRTPPLGMPIPELPSGPIAVSAREPSQKIATREPSQKIATREPSQKIATPTPPTKPPAAADLPAAGTAIGKPPAAPPRPTVMGRPALEIPKPAEPVAAAIDLLPPVAATSASPAATPPAATATASSATPPGTPALRADATPAPTPEAPAPLVERGADLMPEPSPTTGPAPITTETVLPAQPETMRVPREIPRRTLFIVGGAAAGVIVLVLAVLSFSRGAKSAKPMPAPTIAATPAPTPAAPAVAAPTPPAPPAAPAPATPEPAAAAPTTPEPAEAAPPPPRAHRTLGGKKVVLEYDPKPTSPTPPPAQAPTPMGEDPATVARAREAYHKGNVKLFAGDDVGAIALYRESLKIYPGYVAGYRGLGLAFEEAGRKDDALIAFHTYVRTVPNAVDATIIRRRIEHLESEKK